MILNNIFKEKKTFINILSLSVITVNHRNCRNFVFKPMSKYHYLSKKMENGYNLLALNPSRAHIMSLL